VSEESIAVKRETLEAIAGLLDSVADPAVPPEVDEVTRFRSGARRVMEDETLGDETKRRLIAVLLVQRERAALPEWCAEAVLAEVSPAPPPWESLPEREERDNRRLRSLGFEVCPTCSRRLLDGLTLDRSARHRRWAAEYEDRRRGAVPDAWE
jgi:hypothetical protein